MALERRLLGALVVPLLTLACTGASSINDDSSTQSCSADEASVRSQIFAPSCDGVGCHGREAPAAGLNLLDTSASALSTTSSALCAGWSLIVPGSPEKSLLYQKLTPSVPCGERMPLAGHLSDAATRCVADWISGLSSGGCETCGGNACVALASDALHCGSCDNACPAGVGCENGRCACAAGATACAGACVDLQSDALNCSGCGKACAAGSTCSNGACSCSDSLQACGDGCADLSSDPAHCGGCGSACAAKEVCLRGQCAAGCGTLQQCGASCVDTQSSVLNCGGCGKACPAGFTCEGGNCACPGGGALCGVTCVDAQSDPKNCGGCGTACGAGEACVAGSCQCAASGSVSFKAEVAPILDANCTSAGCHTGARPKESLGLDIGTAYAELVNVATSQCGGMRKLVVPGSPSTSYLMQKLLAVDLCTGSQMPKAGQSLQQAELDAISGWICAGAPDN